MPWGRHHPVPLAAGCLLAALESREGLQVSIPHSQLRSTFGGQQPWENPAPLTSPPLSLIPMMLGC